MATPIQLEQLGPTVTSRLPRDVDAHFRWTVGGERLVLTVTGSAYAGGEIDRLTLSQVAGEAQLMNVIESMLKASLEQLREHLLQLAIDIDAVVG